MKQAADAIELLLIEDNPVDALLIKQMLRTSQLHIGNIYEADRLEVACHLLETTNIHLVLLDLSLPGGFGIDSYLGLKSCTKKIPIIILTALRDADVALEAIKEGAQDYLIKGEFNSELLARSILYSFERLQHIEVLRQLNEKLLFHIENTPLGFIEWDNELKVKSWSKRTEEIFGWTYKEFVEAGGTGYNQVFIDDQPAIQKISEQLLSGSIERNSIQHRNYKKDGSVIWCEWFNSVQKDKNGKIIAIMSLVRDITESKNAEASIRESEERYRNIVETAQEGIWTFDENNLTNFTNKKTAEILEYSPEEMMGKRVLDFLDEEEKKLSASQIELDKNHPTDYRPLKFITRSGRQVWAKISTNPIFTTDGKYKGILAMVTNFTEQKRLEHELAKEQKRKQLQITAAVLEAQEKERRAIGEELHDNINQLITAVKLYIGMARSTPERGEEFLSKSVEYVNMAIEETRKLAKNLIVPHLKGLGLSQTLQDLADEIRQATPLSIDLEIKDFDETLFREHQKVSLYRIVQEQMSNIIKHARATVVRIQLSKEKGNVILSIADNGIGFDLSMHSKGVGLTNINSRAEVLNGIMEIDSSPGKGCSMRVIMELKKGQ